MLKISIVASLFFVFVVFAPSFVFAVDTLPIDPAIIVEQSEKDLRELYIALIAFVVGFSLALGLLLFWMIHHHHSPHTLS